MTATAPANLRYIGLWPRVWAQLVDNLVLGLCLAPILLVRGWEYFDPSRPKDFTDIMYGTVLPLTVLYLCWRYFQTSPGKYLIRARIVDADTLAAPSGAQLLLRMLGYVPSALVFGLGFLAIENDPRRQGWHDKLARTVVVRVE